MDKSGPQFLFWLWGFIVFQLEGFAIENGVAVVAKPVAEVDVEAVLGQWVLYGDVAMAEDEVVDVLMLQGFEAKLDEHFFFGAEEFFYWGVGMLGAKLAEPCGYAHAGVGVDAAIKPLQQGAAQYLLQKLITVVAGAEAIAMGNEQFFTVELADYGAVVHGNIELFFEVAHHPYIMIAGECFYLQATVAELGELAHEAAVAFGHNVLILEPGIKEIANEVDHGGIGLYLVEPLAQAAFARYAGCAIGDAEVKIGGEINFFTRW